MKTRTRDLNLVRLIYLAGAAAGLLFGMSSLNATNTPMRAYVALAHCRRKAIEKKRKFRIISKDQCLNIQHLLNEIAYVSTTTVCFGIENSRQTF